MKHLVVPAPVLRSAQSFALTGLLPAHSCLALDVRSGLVLLLDLSAPEQEPFLCSCVVTPAAARLLQALAQAYPSCCSYQQIFLTLYHTEGQHGSPVWDPALGMRPVRRARFALAPALRVLGLEVVALPRRGYLLTRAVSGKVATQVTPGNIPRAGEAPEPGVALASGGHKETLHGQ